MSAPEPSIVEQKDEDEEKKDDNCQNDDNEGNLAINQSLDEQARLLYRGEALAPMVRASTTPLRSLALKYGADLVYTEELIDRAISNTNRVVNDELGTIDYLKDLTGISAKQKRKMDKIGGAPVILRIDPKLERGKLVCQLGTGEANLALQAALHVHQDVTSFDINMGCPKKFSVSGGMGSALLSDPDRASDIIKTLRRNLKVPISAKIRLLKDTKSTLDFLNALVGAGAQAVAVHGRRVGDEAMNPADWDTLKEVVSLFKTKHSDIPMLLNGDFYTRDEWLNMQETTGANGVLLGRPALYNTSLFRKPTDGMKGPFGYDSPLLLSKTTVVQDYLQEAIRYSGNYKNIKYVVCEMMNHRRTPTPRVQFMPIKYLPEQTIASVCNCRSLEELCKLWNVDFNSASKDAKTALDSQHQQAGEHVYKDSYFLKDQVGIDEKPTKRAKVESASKAVG
mmetsp:Transcript_21517/g.30398  ORF Transcript_21517/g.30398 Transcript_21517/m.30398 type:complete len:452 (-) Transcript_21517:43-1398(-)